MVETKHIFDHQLIEYYRIRAFTKATKEKRRRADFLLNSLSLDLGDRLATVQRHFKKALDLHSHTNLVALALKKSGKVDKIDRVETNPLFLNPNTAPHISPREVLAIQPQSADLVTSVASLHLINDVPGILIQIRHILKPDGLFLGVLASEGTLGELRTSLIEAEMEIYGGMSPRVAPFMDVRDAGGLLQRAGFAMPVADCETLTVRYDTAFDLMDDLRSWGMQNALFARSRRPVSKHFFLKMAQIYSDKFCDPDGRIRATFNFVWLSGWAPHPLQQKPAQRGSARASLKDFL